MSDTRQALRIATRPYSPREELARLVAPHGARERVILTPEGPRLIEVRDRLSEAIIDRHWREVYLRLIGVEAELSSFDGIEVEDHSLLSDPTQLDGGAKA